MTEFEQEIARLMVESLNLEIDPLTLDAEAPLFGEGLGLDSIDLLELSVVISKRFGFQIKSDDPDLEETFSNLRSLAKTISIKRTC